MGAGRGAHSRYNEGMKLLGRGEAIEEVRDLLEISGTVMVTGPPGIGKSALAREVRGALWVDLEGARSRNDVLQRLALALEAPAAVEGALLERLARHPVVVLDGAEGAEEALKGLLGALKGHTDLVVTSRSRLALDMPVLELGPLSPLQGAALIRSTFRSVRQASTLEQSALVALCEALDGVPLALELAAKRLRLYSPEQVRELGLRQLMDRSRPPRQDLVAAVLESAQMVSEGAREVLGVASRVPGTVVVDLLREMVGRPVDEDVLELLDASLLHPLGGRPPTFRVLAPVREAVEDLIDDAVWQPCLRRLAARVLGSAEEVVDRLDGPLFEPAHLSADTGLLELLVGADDPAVRLRAALVLAARERHGGHTAATLRRDDLLPDEGPRGLRVRWAFAVDAAASLQRDFPRAYAALDRVDSLLTDNERAASLSSRAVLRQIEGEGTAALSLAKAAAAMGRDPWLHFRLGTVLTHHGSFEDAARSFRIAASVDSAFRRAQATCSLCQVLRTLGRHPDEILAVLDQAMGVAEADQYSWLSARVYHLRGIVAGDLGDLKAARAHMTRAWKQRRQYDKPAEALGVWLDLQSLDYVEGKVPEGLLGAVDGDFLPVEKAWLDVARATAHAMNGHTAAALALGPPGVELLRSQGAPSAAELAAPLAVALAPSRPEEASALLDGLADRGAVALARQIVEGGRPEPGLRLEERVVTSLATLHLQRLRVRLDGKAFVGPDGVVVDIGRRRVLCRVLSTLVNAPRALDVADICGAVWPGEVLLRGSDTRRVHVAISTLRGLGLRHAIRTETDRRGTTRWRLLAQGVETL